MQINKKIQPNNPFERALHNINKNNLEKRAQ